MAESGVILPADSVGKALRSETLTTAFTTGAGGVVHQQVVSVGDPATPANLVVVDASGRITAVIGAALPAGTNTIGNVGLVNGANQASVKAASTAVAATDLPLAVGLHPSSPLPAGTNAIGTVQQAALTKGTQGATGVTTQDLKDAGRNPVVYYMLIPVLTTATDTLQQLTGTKSGATVTATTTPAVVTAGKTFRIQRMWATYVATATSGYGIVRLRYNTGGLVLVSSPVLKTMAIGAGAPTTANATGSEDAVIPDGTEVPAGTGLGISVQGFAAATATAVGYVMAGFSGYEY